MGKKVKVERGDWVEWGPVKIVFWKNGGFIIRRLPKRSSKK